jgi:hypothetical protein
LLLDKVVSGLFKLRLLFTHNLSQQLVFETGFSDNKVNNSALGSDFGLVMRVLHLGLQVKFKSASNFTLLSSKLNELVLTLLGEGSGK